MGGDASENGHRTQLDYRGCTSIGNQHGNLVCETAKPDTAKLPPGKYVSSCHGCKLIKNNERLQCDRCSAGTGRWKLAWIDVQHCESFGNRNGALICTRLTKYNDSTATAPHSSSSSIEEVIQEILIKEVDEQEGEDCNTSPPEKENQVPTTKYVKSTKIFLPNGVGMPEGNYQSSCVGCSVQTDIQTGLPSRLMCALCRGGRVAGPSRISLLGCRIFGVLNGLLTCEEEDLEKFVEQVPSATPIPTEL